MKKLIALLLGVTIISSFAGCQSGNENSSANSDNVSVSQSYDKPYYSSKDEVSIEKITEKTIPSKIVEETVGYKADIKYSGFGDDALDGASAYESYKKIGDVIHINQYSEYQNGQYTLLYFNNDANDRNMYVKSSEGSDVSPFGESEINPIVNESFLGLDTLNAEIKEIKEENGKYIVSVDISEIEQQETLTIDPTTGLIEKVVSTYKSYQGNDVSEERTFTYSSDIEIDMTPKTNGEEPEENNTPISENGKISFTSTDINGNPVSMDDFKNAKLIMVNFWEPWCGPCVGEMPELQELYENYKDKGLVILGVTSDMTVEDDAKAIIKDKGIEYPIILGNKEISCPTEYFPTTVFTDGNGNILSAEPEIGAKDYDGWEKIIKSYLE